LLQSCLRPYFLRYLEFPSQLSAVKPITVRNLLGSLKIIRHSFRLPWTNMDESTAIREPSSSQDCTRAKDFLVFIKQRIYSSPFPLGFVSANSDKPARSRICQACRGLCSSHGLMKACTPKGYLHTVLEPNSLLPSGNYCNLCAFVNSHEFFDEANKIVILGKSNSAREVRCYASTSEPTKGSRLVPRGWAKRGVCVDVIIIKFIPRGSKREVHYPNWPSSYHGLVLHPVVSAGKSPIQVAIPGFAAKTSTRTKATMPVSSFVGGPWYVRHRRKHSKLRDHGYRNLRLDRAQVSQYASSDRVYTRHAF